MSRALRSAVVAVLAVAVGCSSADSRAAAPTFTTLSRPSSETSTTTTTSPPDSASSIERDADADLGDVSGLIAAAGRTGLRIHRPDGEVVVDLLTDRIVQQPTWSRSGDALVTTVIDPGTGLTQIGLIDPSTWEVETVTAVRPYFFYSWNVTGDRIAALGPGRVGGTAIDFIDDAGGAAADSTISGVSMFVAWEPDGSDLLVHANDQLLLIDDFAAVEGSAELGEPGIRFQAPNWIPGTRSVVFARADGVATELLRQDVDTGEQTLLGDLTGFGAISVHPQGQFAAVTHGTFGEPPSTTPDTVQAAFQPSERTIELVDLSTGARTPILDEIGLWMEWDPSGERLLIATERQGQVVWHIYDDSGVRELFIGRPTPTFVQRYLPFADQYVESPRLWSPDGRAFVVTTEIDGTGQAVAVDASTGATATIGRAEIAFWGPALSDP